MSIPEQFQEQFKAFPASLRALVEAELDAGNAIVAPDMDAIRADMDARQRRADAEMDR